MPREKDGYRDQLENIIAAFPDRECLSPKDVSAYCGRNYRTVLKMFPWVGSEKLMYITRTSLARALVSGERKG